MDDLQLWRVAAMVPLPGLWAARSSLAHLRQVHNDQEI